jgi:hypothetical protein
MRRAAKKSALSVYLEGFSMMTYSVNWKEEVEIKLLSVRRFKKTSWYAFDGGLQSQLLTPYNKMMYSPRI